MSEKKEIAVIYEVNGVQVKLTPEIVKNYITGGAEVTMQEFKLFTELCKVHKLNPFLKEAYCIKYGTAPAQMIVGKDVILKRALLHPQYDGMESGIIVQDKETKQITERQGVFYIPEEEKVVGGWAKVYRKDVKYPRYMSVAVGEAIQTRKDGTPNTMWTTKLATMIEKVAKVRALRECFVDEFSGEYKIEGEEEPIEEIKDVTPIQQEEPQEQEEEVLNINEV
ncbi:MAG: phage recombination protein Bet [Firmicutes bacterium]|nr:phage recombination protein Bet [Bacillota bacterium]